jgi:glutamate-1-semialdehyde 2,1-aminomutase
MRKNSEKLFHEAQQYIPGGVNSPVRAFKGVGGTPVFFQSAEGCVLTDSDDNLYIDYIGSWGPMILGHRFSAVTEAVQEQLGRGFSFGAPTELETQLAKTICGIAPNVQLVRMVNSGTEACMSAIRLARGYTGRDKFIKFEGCYHGHADSFLIKAGSGASTLGIPTSPGVPIGAARDTLVAPYNNLAFVQALAAEHKNEIAAIILEPVAGNMGCVLPEPGFIEGLRRLCDDEGIVLIFDEVMTGFRLAKGGAQEYLGINADLVCYGKIIGGGMPVGAYGGKKEIMSQIAPLGPVYQAGTLSGNPLAMASGLATLNILGAMSGMYSHLADLTASLEDGLRQMLEKKGIEYCINRCGSMISVFFGASKVANFDMAAKSDQAMFAKFFHNMLSNGIYLPPSQYETWFLSIAHTPDIIARTLDAASKSIADI